MTWPESVRDVFLILGMTAAGITYLYLDHLETERDRKERDEREARRRRENNDD